MPTPRPTRRAALTALVLLAVVLLGPLLELTSAAEDAQSDGPRQLKGLYRLQRTTSEAMALMRWTQDASLALQQRRAIPPRPGGVGPALSGVLNEQWNGVKEIEAVAYTSELPSSAPLRIESADALRGELRSRVADLLDANQELQEGLAAVKYLERLSQSLARQQDRLHSFARVLQGVIVELPWTTPVIHDALAFTVLDVWNTYLPMVRTTRELLEQKHHAAQALHRERQAALLSSAHGLVQLLSVEALDLAEETKRLRQLEKQVAELKKKYDEAQTAKIEAETKVGTQQRRKVIAQDSIGTWTKRRADAQGSVAAWERLKTDAGRDRDDWQKRAADAERSVAPIEARFAIANEAHEDTKRHLARVQQNLRDFRREAEELTRKRDSLLYTTCPNGRNYNECDHWRLKRAYDKEKERLTGRLNQSLMNILAEEKLVRELEKKAAGTKADAVSAGRDLAKAKATYEDAKRESQGAESTLGEAKGKLRDAKQSLADATRHVKDAEDELEGITEELQEAREELGNAEARLQKGAEDLQVAAEYALHEEWRSRATIFAEENSADQAAVDRLIGVLRR